MFNPFFSNWISYSSFDEFVNTTLEVAQKRNQERARKLPPKLLAGSWKQVQQNLGKFNGLFKSNFLVVDNSKTMGEKEATQKFEMLVKKGIGKFIGRKIKNPIGKRWINNQKILKNKLGDKKMKIKDPPSNR